MTRAGGGPSSADPDVLRRSGRPPPIRIIGRPRNHQQQQWLRQFLVSEAGFCSCCHCQASTWCRVGAIAGFYRPEVLFSRLLSVQLCTGKV